MYSFFGFAQKREMDSFPKNLEEYIIVKPGDTLTIVFDEISIFPKQRFKSTEDIRYYLWFKTKVFKAYPYARLASQRLDTLNNRLERIRSNRKKRKYIKLIQDYMEGEFTDQLKKMTKTEGRILIKLFYRKTVNSTFVNLKELRSGW